MVSRAFLELKYGSKKYKNNVGQNEYHSIYPLRYGDTLLASKCEHLKCILFQRDFP